MSEYAERAVGSLDSFANALREQDVRSLVSHVEDFARRQPVLFLAGSVALGFAAARFLKSSAQGDGGDGQGSGAQYAPSYDSSGYRAGRSGGASGYGTEYGRHIDSGQGGSRQTQQSPAGSRSASGQSGAGPATGGGSPSSPQYGSTRSTGPGTRASAEEIERAMRKEPR